MAVAVRLAWLVTVGVVLLVGACGGSSPGGEAATEQGVSSTTASVSVAAEDVELASVRGYFEALAGGSAEVNEAMFDHVAPGSPADLYADFQYFQGGLRSVDLDVSRDAVELCYQPEGAAAVICAAFDAFQFDDEGRLTSFATNGVPVGDRMAHPTAPTASPDGVSVSVVTALETAGDSLDVIIELRNEADVDYVPVFGGIYDAEDGNRLYALGIGGPERVAPGETTWHCLRIEGGVLGGTLHHVGHLDGSDDALTFEVTVEGGAPASPWS